MSLDGRRIYYRTPLRGWFSRGILGRLQTPGQVGSLRARPTGLTCSSRPAASVGSLRARTTGTSPSPPEEAPAFRPGRNPAPGRGGPAKPGQPKARSAQDLLLSLTDQAKEW